MATSWPQMKTANLNTAPSLLGESRAGRARLPQNLEFGLSWMLCQKHLGSGFAGIELNLNFAPCQLRNIEMFKQTDYLCHPVARPGKQGVQASKHRAICKDHGMFWCLLKMLGEARKKKDAKPAPMGWIHSNKVRVRFNSWCGALCVQVITHDILWW